MKNIRNREAGTLGISSNNHRGSNPDGYEWDNEHDIGR